MMYINDGSCALQCQRSMAPRKTRHPQAYELLFCSSAQTKLHCDYLGHSIDSACVSGAYVGKLLQMPVDHIRQLPKGTNSRAQGLALLISTAPTLLTLPCSGAARDPPASGPCVNAATLHNNMCHADCIQSRDTQNTAHVAGARVVDARAIYEPTSVGKIISAAS